MHVQHFGQSAIQLLDGGLDLDTQPSSSHPAADAPLTFATCFQGCGGLEKCEVQHARVSPLTTRELPVLKHVECRTPHLTIAQRAERTFGWRLPSQELEELSSESASLHEMQDGFRVDSAVGAS